MTFLANPHVFLLLVQTKSAQLIMLVFGGYTSLLSRLLPICRSASPSPHLGEVGHNNDRCISKQWIIWISMQPYNSLAYLHETNMHSVVRLSDSSCQWLLSHTILAASDLTPLSLSPRNQWLPLEERTRLKSLASRSERLDVYVKSWLS